MDSRTRIYKEQVQTIWKGSSYEHTDIWNKEKFRYPQAGHFYDKLEVI